MLSYEVCAICVPVSSMSSSERVVHIDIAEFGQRLLELLDLLLACLDLSAGFVDAFALLFDVKAQVLEQDDRARLGISACRLNLVAYAVGQELHGFVDELGELVRHRLHRVLQVHMTVRSTQVAHEHERACTVLQRVVNGRQRGHDALVVRYYRTFHWHIVVDSEPQGRSQQETINQTETKTKMNEVKPK